MPPDGIGRAEALAGLAWALTLVNLRRPEVVAEALARADGDLAPGGPVEHGVCAALLVWTAAAGRDALVERFLDGPTRPPRTRGRRGSWRDLLDRCAGAVDTLPPLLTSADSWPKLFRFRPLEALEADLIDRRRQIQ